jgi:hypothetical protein
MPHQGGTRVAQDDKPDKPGRHDAHRDGQGVYQPDKTEKPHDYGRGRHRKDEPKKDN